MTISNRNTKYKRSGSILASVMVAAIVWIMIAQSMFITFSGQFKMISSSRTALQAQQYAEIALDKLKNIKYDELDASGVHGRQKIEGISSDDWQDEVTIGAESTIAGSDDAKQRIATVNVYKVGDTLPRYTVELPLSSQGSNILPIGTILPYIGDLSKIPHGWFLCDGTNGTPDLRDRFLQGSNTAGTFIEAGLPNLWGRIVASDDTWRLPSSYLGVFRRIGSYGSQDGGNGECLVEFNAHNYNAIYKDGCNTVQPPAYTVYYIIRMM